MPRRSRAETTAAVIVRSPPAKLRDTGTRAAQQHLLTQLSIEHVQPIYPNVCSKTDSTGLTYKPRGGYIAPPLEVDRDPLFLAALRAAPRTF